MKRNWDWRRNPNLVARAQAKFAYTVKARGGTLGDVRTQLSVSQDTAVDLVRLGKRLHAEDETCPHCGYPIPSDHHGYNPSQQFVANTG